MRIRFSFFTGLSAFLIAGCAAYYSVFGLSHLFAGASIAVILMASCLELSKIIAVSFLQRYWESISKSLRVYMAVCVFILMCITSAGIYGFLSNAYQKTSNKLDIINGKVSILKNKSDLFENKIKDNQSIILSKSKRVDLLNSVRIGQESRLTEAIYNSNRRSIRNEINNSSSEIYKLTADIDKLNTENNSLSDSVNKYKSDMINEQSDSEVSTDIGPLKYITELTGYPMGKVVNIFILLLIFVFDPLAVALVVATNKIMQLDSKENESKTLLSNTVPEKHAVSDSILTIPTPEFNESNIIKEELPEKTIQEELLKPKEEPIKQEPVKLSSNEETKIVKNDLIMDLPDESFEIPKEEPKIPQENQDAIQEPAIELTPKPLEEPIQGHVEEPIQVPVEEPITEPIEGTEYKPVIPNGKIDLESIREKKQERGFSVSVPLPRRHNSNTIERLKNGM